MNAYVTGAQSVVRGANEHATFNGPGAVYGSNLISFLDSSFEGYIGGWTDNGGNGTNCTIDMSSTYAYLGTHSLSIYPLVAGECTVSKVNNLQIAGGQLYVYSAWVYTANTGRQMVIEADYFDSTGALVTADQSPFVTLSANTWTQVKILTYAQSNAATVGLNLHPYAQSGSEIFYVDDVQFNPYSVIEDPYGQFSVTDYECPLNTPVTYTVQMGTVTLNVATQTASVTSPSVQLDAPSGTVWVKNLIEPSLNAQTSVSTVSDLVRASKAQATYVIGRANPVVLSDVRGGRTGTLTFTTLDLTSRTALLALLNSPASTTLLLQVTASDGFEDMYFCVTGDLTEQRPSPLSTDETRLWLVPFTEVDSPADTATEVTSNSYLELLNWSTYGDMLNQRATYLQVLTAPFGSMVGDSA